MEIKQLQSTPGFVIYDVAGAQNYVGPARLGAKLIASNATMLARHLTYVFATLEMQRSGSSIGLKSDPGDAATAVAALEGELADEFSSQQLLTSPGLRLDTDLLAPVLAHDKRNPISGDDRDGVSFGDELVGVGAAAAAGAVLDGGLAGKKAAIEGFDTGDLGTGGLAVAREVLAQGGSVIAVSDAKGCASGDFSLEALGDAALNSGGADEVVASLGSSNGASAGKPWEIWSNSDADVVFCGSKPGALSGEGAASVASTGAAVVAWSAAAVSTKALADLRKGETTVVADFVSALGPALSWWADPETTHDQLREQTMSKVAAVMAETSGHDDGHFMAACYRAEQFMSTWLEELPFGRPMN